MALSRRLTYVPPSCTLYLDQFLIFVLVLTRVGSLLMTLPVLGTATVPMQVRALLAVGHLADPHAAFLGPADSAAGKPARCSALLLAREAMLGLALGLAVMILLSGMQLAGQIISQTSGMSLADVANPTFDTSVPLFSQILEMLALAIFFLVGGHRQVIDALLGSFTWMPPGKGRLPDNLVEALSDDHRPKLRSRHPRLGSRDGRPAARHAGRRPHQPHAAAAQRGRRRPEFQFADRARHVWPSASAPPPGCFRKKLGGRDRHRRAVTFALLCRAPSLWPRAPDRMAAEEFGDKTHEATPYRRQKAREEGQVVRSQDLASAGLLDRRPARSSGTSAAAWPISSAGWHSDHLGGEAWLSHRFADDRAPVAAPRRGDWPSPCCRCWRSCCWPRIVTHMGQFGFLYLPQKLALDWQRINPLQNCSASSR